MTQAVPQPIAVPSPEAATLDALVSDIHGYEAIVSTWDDHQRATVAGLKRSIEALHREALVRLIRSVKRESLPALRQAVEDEVVYSLLRYYELVKPPTPPLEQRLQLALAEVRPSLNEHQGDVELAAIRLPDTVEVRLTGTCSHCPAASLTLADGVEQAIKRHCPEIQQVIAVSSSDSVERDEPHLESGRSAIEAHQWLEVTSLTEVPQGQLLAMKLAGYSLLLTRIGSEVKCYQNVCSHLGQSLDSGEVDQGILTCPHHRFQYRLDTGECLTSPEMPLSSYSVRIQDGRVLVHLA